jgi:hypothetical protein
MQMDIKNTHHSMLKYSYIYIHIHNISHGKLIRGNKNLMKRYDSIVEFSLLKIERRKPHI